MATIVTRAGKGSALTWTEGDANITNLNNDKMEKSAPVLAGNLDVATYSITTTTTNGNIVIEPNGTGDVHIITDALRIGDLNAEARISTYGTGNLVLTTNEGNDPDPTITIGNGANANITLLPSGTGSIVLDGQNWPQADGTADQVLKTNGSGQLSWTTVSGGGGDVVSDTTPQLGGDLDVNGNSIVSVSNGNIQITPNGTGQTVLKNIEYNENIYALGTTGGTIAPNVTNGNVQTITLNSALTMNGFTSPVAGQSLTLIINGGTAYTSITSTMKFAGGIKTLTGTAGCIDILTVFYDGTNYFASLGKGFA
jgi:hypothetical protein